MPIRKSHKLRALPGKQDEFVLCTGAKDRFEIVRYFWKNVDCPDCIALKDKKVRAKR